MKLPIQSSKLINDVSDDIDQVLLANETRELLNRQVDAWVLSFPTSDATLTAVWSDQMPPDSVGDFMLTVVGGIAGAASVAGYRRRVVVVRVGSGAVAYMGAGADIIGVDKETVPAWDVAFGLDASTPDLLYACVQGAAATNITWRVHVTGTVSPWA